MSPELNASIDAHAERAKAEIGLMRAVAWKQIRRIAEFPARSEGQKRRHQKGVEMYIHEKIMLHALDLLAEYHLDAKEIIGELCQAGHVLAAFNDNGLRKLRDELREKWVDQNGLLPPTTKEI